MTVKGECICGAVKITAPAPVFVNDCNCSSCARRGALWAYYPTAEVDIRGGTMPYVRSDIREPALAVHHCATCGVTTHWSRLPGSDDDRFGINARLFDYGTLDGVEVRHCDGRSWEL